VAADPNCQVTDPRYCFLTLISFHVLINIPPARWLSHESAPTYKNMSAAKAGQWSLHGSLGS
jgi:hypothetical protein